MGNERENKEINEAGITFYHERQQLQYCLKHALNNLLQRPAFTIESLNDICKNLDNTSFLNPHRSILGLGNYDVNVLMVAMSSEEKDLSIIWFDSRMSYECIKTDKVIGYVFNKPSTGIWGWVTGGRHWFTILRHADGRHYNLDSKLRKPEKIEDFPAFFKEHLESNGHVMIVVKNCDAEDAIERSENGI